jgi:hypothetical protein
MTLKVGRIRAQTESQCEDGHSRHTGPLAHEAERVPEITRQIGHDALDGLRCGALAALGTVLETSKSCRGGSIWHSGGPHGGRTSRGPALVISIVAHDHNARETLRRDRESTLHRPRSSKHLQC